MFKNSVERVENVGLSVGYRTPTDCCTAAVGGQVKDEREVDVFLRIAEGVSVLKKSLEVKREDEWRHKDEQMFAGGAKDKTPGTVVGRRSRINGILHPDAVFAVVLVCDRQLLRRGKNIEARRDGTLLMAVISDSKALVLWQQRQTEMNERFERSVAVVANIAGNGDEKLTPKELVDHGARRFLSNRLALGNFLHPHSIKQMP